MKEHMKYIIDHAEEIVKLIKVKAQVSEVKSIMLENIDKVLYCLGVRLFLFFYPGIQSFPSAVVTLHLGLMYSPLAFLCSSLLKSSMKARGGGI